MTQEKPYSGMLSLRIAPELHSPRRRRGPRRASETIARRRSREGLAETASGAKTDRVQLRRAIGQLGKGDVLMVTRLDRLAWADSTTAHGRLMLTVLGGLAEFERELIRARTGEGRERAKAKGVKMGRKPKMTDHQKREAIKRRDREGETLRSIGRSYNVSAATIARLEG
jgi:DNA invertase Pin-like site-specific DNA recombinase